MKRHTLFAATVLLGTTLFASACDEGLADINEDPNAPTDVPAQYVLPNAIQNTVEQFYGQWFNLEFTGLFAQHWAKIQYVEEDQFDLRPAVITGWWENLYAGSLKDWQLIIDKGQEPAARCGGPCVNVEATGLTMKAFTAHVMTDIWGDMPYSEALQGDDPENPITRPAYDSQQAIYTAMVSELDAALSLFDPGEPSWGVEDLIYSGDVAAWMRFANSLKLRLAMRISDVDASTAQQWAEQAAAHPAGLITANSQSAKLTFLDASPNQNPLFENAKTRDDHGVSQTLVNLLASLDDPRLEVYAEPASKDSVELPHVVFNGQIYRGQPNGVPESQVLPLPTVSRIGDQWRDVSVTANATTPYWLMTAAEVHFLLAEARLNGWNVGGTAQGHYEAGVTASLQQWNGMNGVTIDAADIASYLAEPGVAWGTGDSDLEQIIEQKWIALYTNGPEAYAEYRRTGFPDEITVRSGHILPYVPDRVPYPLTEQSLNNENLQAALQAQGIDGTYTGKIWWDPVAPDS